MDNHISNRLGLNNPISRRDFLNGVLLTGASGLIQNKAPTIWPEDALNGYGGIGDDAYQSPANGMCRVAGDARMPASPS